MYKYSMIFMLSILCVLFGVSHIASADKLSYPGDRIDITTNYMNNENINFDPYSGKYMGDVYKVTNGKLEKVNFQEYLNNQAKSNATVKMTEEMKSQNQSINKLNDISPMEVNYRWYEFERTGQYEFHAGWERVSATIMCPSASVSCSIAQQYSLTKSQSWNAGFGIDLTKKIKTNAGFTWTDSATVSSTYTFTIKPGAQGYVAFNPRYNQTVGWAKTYDSIRGLVSKDWVDARSPYKLNNGQLDGWVTFFYE